MTAHAEANSVRTFFSALLIPLVVGVMLALSAVTFGPRAALTAFILNAFLLSEVAGFSGAMPLPMPAWYLRPMRFERRWIYEFLGVRMFQKLMRSAVYRRINPHCHLSGGRNGLAALGETMCAADVAHALGFLASGVFAAATLMLGWLDAALWILFFNVLFNGYPVMLQRYNRLRLLRLTLHLSSRRSCT
jgi:hypothetical protein